MTTASQDNSFLPCRPSGCPRPWRMPTCWLVLLMLDCCLIALSVAQDSTPATPTDADTTVTRVDGPAGIGADAVRFEALDVFVDSGDHQLAAWQLEMASRTAGAEIVGIEGGEHPAFRKPPYYDPQAMHRNHVILAAYHTGRDLPSGRSRVARVHLQLTGPGPRDYLTSLTASANADGEQIPARVSIARSESPR